FVLVNSPVTIDGVITRVTPVPFEVLMVVSSSAQVVPVAVGVHSGLTVPVLELRTQTVGSTAASKLPLLCARAVAARPPTSVSTARRATRGCKTGRLREPGAWPRQGGTARAVHTGRGGLPAV